MNLGPLSKKSRESTRSAESCNNCRYFKELEDLEDEDRSDPEIITGICRRYPPRLFPGIPYATSEYPEVCGSTGWCGEYTPGS